MVEALYLRMLQPFGKLSIMFIKMISMCLFSLDIPVLKKSTLLSKKSTGT